MNTIDLIKRIATDHELTKTQARAVVESVFAAIAEAAANRARFAIGRVCVVAERGTLSAAKAGALPTGLTLAGHGSDAVAVSAAALTSYGSAVPISGAKAGSSTLSTCTASALVKRYRPACDPAT